MKVEVCKSFIALKKPPKFSSKAYKHEQLFNSSVITREKENNGLIIIFFKCVFLCSRLVNKLRQKHLFNISISKTLNQRLSKVK